MTDQPPRQGELIQYRTADDAVRLKLNHRFSRDYLEGLLERIREMHASARRFYLKITEIHEPDAGESSFPHEIKKHFWESVGAAFTDAQVIVIENGHQLPDDGTLDGVKVELFTGNDQGRRGFIPQAAGVA